MKYKATIVFTIPPECEVDAELLQEGLTEAVSDNFINSDDGETLDSVIIEPA